METTLLICSCTSCGEELEFDAAESGQLCRCPDCDTPFMLPYGAAPAGRDGEPAESVEESPSHHRHPAPLSDNVPMKFGSSVPSAYCPSGAAGDVGILFARGLVALVAEVAAGAGGAALAVVVNVIHNLLPVFIFVVPVLIVLILVAAPIVFGRFWGG